MRRAFPPVDTTVPVLLASCLALFASSASAHDKPATFRVVAGPASKPLDKAGGGTSTVRETLSGLRVTVEYLDPERRAAYIRSRSPGQADPFAAPHGAPPGAAAPYNVFRVAFENGAAGDVQFQPGNTILITDRSDQDHPVDLTDVYRVAVGAELPDPEGIMSRLAPLMFDTSTTIRQGETDERLLVFGPLPAKWRELQVVFSFLQIGTSTRTVTFPFHRQAVKE